MKTGKPVHPLLLALFPTLFLYSHNMNDYPLSVVVVPLLATIVFMLLCWLALRLILRHAVKAALGVSLLLLLFFSYGHLYDLLWYPFAVRPFTFGAEYVLLPLCGLVFLVGMVLLRRTHRDLSLLTRWANYAAVLLLVVPVISIALTGLTAGKDMPTGEDSGDEVSSAVPAPLADPPDIYYLILDGFAREDILAELYDYPHSALPAALEQRGFFVARRAGANYCQTALSLASSLNYKYLDPAEDGYEPNSTDRAPLTHMIANNRVMKYLQARGYTTVACATGYDPTALRNADVFLEPVGKVWFLDEFQSGLLQTTPVPHLVPEMDCLPFIGGGLSHPQANSRRKMIRRIFEMLGEMPARKSPKFVFAHLITPHPPFLFGPRGEELNPEGVFDLSDGNAFFSRYGKSRRDYLTGYRNQLMYIEQLVIAMVDAILANSTRPPIIILQADHGPGAYLDWNSSTRSNIRERLGILNACYFPDGGDTLLYDTITPVNTFRSVFRHYFGEDLELLPDESYFSLWNNPYWFVPVGNQVRGDTLLRP